LIAAGTGQAFHEERRSLRDQPTMPVMPSAAPVLDMSSVDVVAAGSGESEQADESPAAE
jgi:hypothetical protein